MAASEDALEIDDTEILQFLEETLYKAPVATASDLPTSPVAAPSSVRPGSQIEQVAPTLGNLEKPAGLVLSTPGLRQFDRPDSSGGPQCSSLKATNGAGAKRKVTVEAGRGGGMQNEVAPISQMNWRYSSLEGIPCLEDSEDRVRSLVHHCVDAEKVLDKACESPLLEELRESNVGSPPPQVLPYVIPGPGGLVQKALNAGELVRSRQVFPNRKKDYRVFEQGKSGIEETRFTEEPWFRAVDAVTRRAGERATVSDIKASGFEGPVSKFVARIVALTLDGYGGAFVTLEDPTGRINGTIHKSVLAVQKYAERIESGAIILLQNVPIFRPNDTARLISITATNVVQVLKEGMDTPWKETQSCGKPSQASSVTGIKHGAATEYGGTARVPMSFTPAPREIVPSSCSVQSEVGRVREGKQVDDANSTKPCRENPADADHAYVAKAVGWDLEEDLDKLLDCSIEDLYN